MILNVSGRTDICAFYSEWFFNRIQAGFVDVRNPFYRQHVSRIYFEDVDAIVFCTKNPMPMLNHLEELKVPFMFQITITPYRKDIEPGIADKRQIIAAVKQISDRIGKDRVYIRFDPLLLNDIYDTDYLIRGFKSMCGQLDGYVDHIIISFIDDYKNVRLNMQRLKLRKFTEKDYEQIGINFAEIANEYGMSVQTCAEERNLSEFGFVVDDCVNNKLAYELTGKLKHKQWKGRKNSYCHCVEMADIGSYNTCRHYCSYCYANYCEKEVSVNVKMHDPKSSLLIGHIQEDDIIIRRTR